MGVLIPTIVGVVCMVFGYYWGHDIGYTDRTIEEVRALLRDQIRQAEAAIEHKE